MSILIIIISLHLIPSPKLHLFLNLRKKPFGIIVGVLTYTLKRIHMILPFCPTPLCDTFTVSFTKKIACGQQTYITKIVSFRFQSLKRRKYYDL